MLLQKKERNVCYNFFESSYSELLEKKIFPTAKLKKIISRNFQVSHWKKKPVDYFRSKKAKENISSKKKFCTVNLPWNDPYIYIYMYMHIHTYTHTQLHVHTQTHIHIKSSMRKLNTFFVCPSISLQFKNNVSEIF